VAALELLLRKADAEPAVDVLAESRHVDDAPTSNRSNVPADAGRSSE